MKEIKYIFKTLIEKLILDVKTDWNKIVYSAIIYNDNCKMQTKYLKNGVVKYFNLGFDNTFEISDISCSLRDQILAQTGKRIWGLTFCPVQPSKHKTHLKYR